MKPESLKKEHEVKDGKIEVVETVKAVFTRQDLINEKATYARKKDQIVQQIQQLSKAYDEITEAEVKVEGYLTELGPVELPKVPTK
jgi:hypothetical protein